MKLAVVHTRGCLGIEAPPVTVEAHISSGLPAFHMVGLPEMAVKESKERVRSAIINAGLKFPSDWHLTVNLAPADLPKGGGRFDLAIALGILAAFGQVRGEGLDGREFYGELALSGEIRPIQGLLPSLLACSQAGRCCIAPAANGEEAGLLREAEVKLGAHLLDIVACLQGEGELNGPARRESEAPVDVPDLLDVRGQHAARRALCIAAAGGHNLLLRGPPGTGKTMLASRMPGILPPLSDQQALEVAAIRSISRLGVSAAGWHRPPFRSPHHTSSAVALVGGGSTLHAGEISLAHHGVLFLDEVPEFSPRVLEVLREPMESGSVMISRVRYQVAMPAAFQLVAAMNPCPCGFHGDRLRECRCPEEKVQRYQQRISGPLLDRIDMHVEVARPAADEGAGLLRGESDPAHGSAAIRERVVRCRRLQLERAGMVNARFGPKELKRHCRLNPEEAGLLAQAMESLRLTARAGHRILKIARTIADLEDAAAIGRDHLLEAINYRRFDRC